MRGQINEIRKQLQNTNNEAHELQIEYGEMRSLNKMINRENDELKAEIHRLRSRLTADDSGEIADAESDCNDSRPARPVKKQKIKSKGKRPVHCSEEEAELDEEGARVCYIS